jgi:hypothetical protein
MTSIITGVVLFILVAFVVGMRVGRWCAWRDDESGWRKLGSLLEE